ncbi:pentatricopeptide repeat-containing protein mitochondrial-like [Trifolium pratense]|uniref:Pentatricopeptide repeat-containing protein mitochondrial-like n=1 Tax=Trifolium pratense TaxID=57577 RepID=A0A2K3LL13_TRIPR|nr:pentatricopeptide repeat-containing protein mitochondrial-like [Trifolium pratense]
MLGSVAGKVAGIGDGGGDSGGRWPLRQLDVKYAFLHGDLLEEVYTNPPPGFTPKGVKKYGFKQAMADHTLFYKRVGTDITLLIVYDDDMIVTGSNLHEIGELRDYLAMEFEMKDLGDLKYFLGIEVTRFVNRWIHPLR